MVLEAFVEGDQSLVGRIDVHHAGDPFHEDRPLRGAGIEALQSIMSIGVDRGPEEQVRIVRQFPGQELVGDMDFGGSRVQPSLSVHRPIQGQDHGLVDGSAVLHLRGDLLQQPGIPVLLEAFTGGIEGFEVEAELPTGLQILGHETPAAAGTDAGRVHMEVDQGRRWQRRGGSVGARSTEGAGNAEGGTGQHRGADQRSERPKPSAGPSDIGWSVGCCRAHHTGRVVAGGFAGSRVHWWDSLSATVRIA